MKMTKKIFLAAIAVAAFAFTGCADLLGKVGKGTTTGTKWNKTMTVDGTKKDLYDTTANPVVPKVGYRRFIQKIKATETVTNISTDIIIDLNKSTIHIDDPYIGTGGNAVVGLAFDFHTTGTGENAKYDFVLVGFAPNTKKYYVERYVDVLSAKASSAAQAMSDKEDEELEDAGFDSSDGSMGTYYNFKKTGDILKITTDTSITYDDWNDIPAGAYDEATGTINVEIKQETPGLYEVYLGGTKVAEYEGETKSTEKNYTDYAAGGVAVYANCPVSKSYDADKNVGKGCKVKVKYSSDKEKTHGLFEEDAE